MVIRIKMRTGCRTRTDLPTKMRTKKVQAETCVGRQRESELRTRSQNTNRKRRACRSGFRVQARPALPTGKQKRVNERRSEKGVGAEALTENQERKKRRYSFSLKR